MCLLAKTALKMIPISVLFGIFLYFGIVSLSGTQLYERIKLIFIPSKYCPSVVYARGVCSMSFAFSSQLLFLMEGNLILKVRPSKRNLFTIIQIVFVIILLFIKSFSIIAYAFPLVLVFLVPLRIYILPNLFTNKELEQVSDFRSLKIRVYFCNLTKKLI